jgi:hypothetical protein
MAAGLGFKTFTTGEVLSAANVNGYLMQGVLVFADATARNAAITSPQEGQCCYLKDTDVIQAYDGSAWVTKSAGGSSGAVVQVKSFSTNSTTVVSNATFTSTALTLSITPTSASNKILITGQMPAYFYQNATGGVNYNGVGLRIVRGATSVFTSDAGEAFGYENFDESASGNMILFNAIPFSYLDSPATTSATTYTLQGQVAAGASTSIFNYHNVGTITLMEVTP